MLVTLLRRFIPVLLLASVWLSAGAEPRHVLKFATLAPSGSTWMNLLEDWGEEVKIRSDGRLLFKFYPGGVQGDEPDVLKKMRFNQLQGGAFTGYGIGRMYSPARVLELPFLFRDVREVDHVRNQFTAQFQDGFRDHGYELLGWMEVGFVHMFSTQPVDSIEGMKSRRVWLWQGDPLGQAFFNASGISPVPLSIVDVYTSLSTGLIDTVYCTPLAAIALTTDTSALEQIYERIDAMEKTQAESRSVMIPRPLYRWPLGLALFFLLLLGLFPDGIPRAWFTRRAHG